MTGARTSDWCAEYKYNMNLYVSEFAMHEQYNQENTEFVSVGEHGPISRRRLLLGAAVVGAMAFIDSITPEKVEATAIEIFSEPMTEHDRLASEHQIFRLYQAAFNRTPDEDGFAFHVASFRDRHISVVRVAQSFTESEEWKNMYDGLDNSAIVTKMYQHVLDREPDQAGHEYWTRLLNEGVDISSVLLGIANSPENVEKTETIPVISQFYNPNEIEYVIDKKASDADKIFTGISGPRVSVTADMLEIARCESTSGEFQINLDGSGANGWYQFMDETWQELQAKVLLLYPWLVAVSTKRAIDAPKELQDLVAFHTIKKDIDKRGIKRWSCQP